MTAVREWWRRRVDPDVAAHLLSNQQMGPLQPPGATAPQAGGPVVGLTVPERHTFCFSPFDLYDAGMVTNVNATVVSDVGHGKSSLVKTMLTRLRAHGTRAVVLDVKGEYGPFLRALDSCRHQTPVGDVCGGCGGPSPGTDARLSHVRLAPGGDVRLNPLDIAGTVEPGLRLQRRQEMVTTLTAAAKTDRLTEIEQSALDEAVAIVSDLSDAPTLDDVVGLMLRADGDVAQALHIDRDRLADAVRPAALALRRLCVGDLAGMFDGHTSAHVDLTADVVVLDLSAVYRSKALPLVMACAGAFVVNALASARLTSRTVVCVEEAWAVLRRPETALFFVSLSKLSRDYGLSMWLVMHRLSDLRATGDVGTETRALAEGLLSDTQIHVVGRQPADQLDLTQAALGMTDAETAAVASLPTAHWLFRVAGSPVRVAHLRTPWEETFTDTDAALVGDRRRKALA